MIYFLIFPLWLLGLAACGVMAFFRPLRILAVYLSLMGTGAAWLSLVCSLAAVIAPDMLGLTYASGLLFLGGYLAGMVFGGLLGAGLGAWAARRLTQGRPIFTLSGSNV